MAEYCLKCYNKLENKNYTKDDVVLSSYPETCEGCGQIKYTVVKVRNKKRTNRILIGVIVANVVLWTIFAILIWSPKKNFELSEEFKQSIINIITYADITERFTVNEIKLLDSGTVSITLSLDETPKNENFVSTNVKHFINEIGKAYNYNLDLQITVVQPIPGTDKVVYYGRGSFYKDVGKINFDPTP